MSCQSAPPGSDFGRSASAPARCRPRSARCAGARAAPAPISVGVADLRTQLEGEHELRRRSGGVRGLCRHETLPSEHAEAHDQKTNESHQHGRNANAIAAAATAAQARLPLFWTWKRESPNRWNHAGSILSSAPESSSVSRYSKPSGPCLTSRIRCLSSVSKGSQGRCGSPSASIGIR